MGLFSLLTVVYTQSVSNIRYPSAVCVCERVSVCVHVYVSSEC